MEAHLRNCMKNNNFNDLKSYLSSLSSSSIVDELVKLSTKDDGPLLLQLLFQGLTENVVRLQIVEKVLSLVQDGKLSAQRSEKMLSVLGAELDALTSNQQIKLIDLCVELFQKASKSEIYPFWKDLLPKLLNLIIECDEVEYNGARMTGTEYKAQIVTGLCTSQWSYHSLASVAAMFIEITLTKEEHAKVVNKLCSYILKMKDEEIPSLTHQLLQLTKPQNSIIVFVSLQQYFMKNLYNNDTTCEGDSEDDRHLRIMANIEGTVLYHINAAASSFGPQSVKDMIKILKDLSNTPEFVLNQFYVNVLLTVSGVSTIFEEETMNLLKTVVQRCIAEENQIKNSAWLETMITSCFNLEEFIKKLIDNSCRERDVILKGLVNLGFTLLTTNRNKTKEGQSERMWKLGTYILSSLVKKYNFVTSTVLQRLANNISQFNDCKQYPECLAVLCKNSPMNVLSHSSTLIQLLDNVCSRLTGRVGQQIITAVIPLTKMSPTLRDNLIMILRKALFPTDPMCRQVAVFGFVEMLRDLKISNLTTHSQSISQNYSGLTQMWSQSFASRTAYSNEGLCLEVLSILREVFKQQYLVRFTFYSGIYNAVCCNRELSNHVLDNLHTQLDKYYQRGDILPPLKFDKVVVTHGGSAVCQEPLGLLVLTVGLVIVKTDEDEDDDGRAYIKLQQMLDSLCERMAQCDVVHFDLQNDGGLHILDTSPECETKQEILRQVLGVYEALLGYIISSWTKSSSNKCQTFLSVFKSYSRLCDFAKSLSKVDKKKLNEDNGKNNRKDKNKITAFKFLNTVLNFKCVCRLVSLLNNESVSWADSQDTTQIKSKREIHRYSLQTTLQLIKQAQQIPDSEIVRVHSLLGYVCHIGRTLFSRCIKRLSEVSVFDHVTALYCVECFQELVTLVIAKYNSNFSNFLADISGESVENGVRKQLKTVIDVLLTQLEERLMEQEDDDDDDGKDEQADKISTTLVSAVTVLANQLQRGGSYLQEVTNRVRKICRERKTENPTVAKGMINLLFMLYVRCTPHGSLMHEIALCLCSNMKLIDEEMEIEEHVSYGVVNERTANVCLVVLCDTLRILINEIEWTVARFRSVLLSMSFPDQQTYEERSVQLTEKEKILCYHVNFSVKVLSTLCAISIPPGVYSDCVLKELADIYNKLTLLTKYFITKVVKYKLQLLSGRFEKTVKLVDAELTKNMYCFTDHVITDGTASIDNTNNKKNKINPTILKSRVMKETKHIPKIVFEKEQFQKFILQLSNKSKIDLVGQTKHALARDYRLYSKQVRDMLEKENVQIEENESVSEDASVEESQNKRQKTQE